MTELTAEFYPFAFRFQWLEGPPQVKPKSREVGQIDSAEVILGSVRRPQLAVIGTRLKDDQLELTVLDPESEEIETWLIKVHDGRERQAKQAIDYGLSRRQARARMLSLADDPGEILVRQLECPHCQSLLVLEGRPTPQFYCDYCETICTEIDASGVQFSESDYRLCDRCQMYSRPRRFTVFFFYFLIYFGGVHHEQVCCCPGCFRRTAWMMLFGNLPFLLGVPVAMVQLARCYLGAIRHGPFRGLHEANTFLRFGWTEQALTRYEAILDRHPLSAGVKYNIAIGLLEQGDPAHACQMFELALQDCSNYTPAQERWVDTLFQMGQTEQALELCRRFRLDPASIEEMAMVYGVHPNPEEEAIAEWDDQAKEDSSRTAG